MEEVKTDTGYTIEGLPRLIKAARYNKNNRNFIIENNLFWVHITRQLQLMKRPLTIFRCKNILNLLFSMKSMSKDYYVVDRWNQLFSAIFDEAAKIREIVVALKLLAKPAIKTVEPEEKPF